MSLSSDLFHEPLFPELLTSEDPQEVNESIEESIGLYEPPTVGAEVTLQAKRAKRTKAASKEERVQRKKLQNLESSRKYRQRHLDAQKEAEQQLNEVTKRNNELKAKMKTIQNSVVALKNVLGLSVAKA